MIVNVLGFPAQPCGDVGVTVMVPTILFRVPFAGAVHDGILPVPVAPKPMAVLLFVQAKVDPGRLLVNAGTVMLVAGQTLIGAIADIPMVGCTATFAIIGTLLQPPRDVVTVYLTVSVTRPEFASVWLITAPVPPDAPVILPGAAAVHEYDTPVLDELRLMIAAALLQMVCTIGVAMASGCGLIFTVKVIALPEHPFKVGTTLIVPLMAESVLLGGAVHGRIFPLPEAARPIAVLVLLQLNVEPAGALTKLLILI